MVRYSFTHNTRTVLNRSKPYRTVPEWSCERSIRKGIGENWIFFVVKQMKSVKGIGENRYSFVEKGQADGNNSLISVSRSMSCIRAKHLAF